MLLILSILLFSGVTSSYHHYRLHIAFDEKIINVNGVKELLDLTNRITAKAALLNLQITGVTEIDRIIQRIMKRGEKIHPDQLILWVATEARDSKTYDSLLVIATDDKYLTKPPGKTSDACHINSISSVQALMGESGDIDREKTSVKIAQVIFQILIGPEDLTKLGFNNCTCSDQFEPVSCLNDDPDEKLVSRDVSSCFKDALSLSNHWTYPKTHANLNCLQRKAEPSDTCQVVTAAGEITMNIKMNGITEPGEDCDCFFFDMNCKCDDNDDSEEPQKESPTGMAKSSSGIVIIIGVLVIFILTVVILFRRKNYVSETLPTDAPQKPKNQPSENINATTTQSSGIGANSFSSMHQPNFFA